MRDSLNTVLGYLRRVVVRRGDSGLSDAQLLQRFVTQRDEAAFEVLVWRHGPMVLGVGRRLLRNAADAEDVLQATFLALVRQARSIGRGGALAGWLYRVAYRTALRAKRRRDRLPVGPAVVEEVPAPQTGADDPWRDVLPALDEELQRLPAKYHTPLVLSYLQGLTNREIADRMGCPIGTVFTRLARGRELLRKQLVRRGVSLTAGLLGATLAPGTAAATLRPGLVTASVQAALIYAAGSGTVAGVLSPNVVTLTEGVLRMMWLSRLKLVGAVLVLFAVAGSGAGLVALRGTAQEQETAPQNLGKAEQPAQAVRRPSKEALRYGGKSFDEWRTVLLTDLKPEMRAEALKALGAFGANGYGREATAIIVETVRGYGPYPGDADTAKVVEGSHSGLSKIGTEAVPVLVEELKNGEKNGRLFALSSLSWIGSRAKEAVPAVKEALKDKDHAIRYEAIKALYSIDLDGNVSVFADAVADDAVEIRNFTLNLMRSHGAIAKVAMPRLLIVAVKDSEPNIRNMALDILLGLKPDTKTAVPTLREVLKDKSQGIRQTAVRALANLGPEAKEAVPDLVAALKNTQDYGEREQIIYALGSIGPEAKAAIPALLEIAVHPNLGHTVLETLKKINK
jgi:RNA polymerase sigma factor (sigma-70 family)